MTDEPDHVGRTMARNGTCLEEDRLPADCLTPCEEGFHSPAHPVKTGGAEGARTPDLLIANETLYQLSYDPIQFYTNQLQAKSLGVDFSLLY